jgi:hypothetical protein
MTADIVVILGNPGVRASRVADAVCDIVIKGAALGAMVDVVVIAADGTRQVFRKADPNWFARLAVAAEAGVFERKEPSAIVDRILMTPEPVGEEGDAHE